ncbi:SCP-like extracellular protein [Phytophthora palmivora]|uniref:SCP-like extracellular protein n=1 Tax=Phytophthora palmivora TaxID=4796 RepID=A0A2P4Y4K9_9STRA|nr:SCP-like extracellular protein [Phytophthora palmivora]
MVSISKTSLALLIAIGAISTGNSNADVTAKLRHESRNLEATYTSTSQYAAAMLASVNAQRAAQGLRPLCINSKLMAASKRHSDDMAARNYMSHTGSDGSTMAQRVTAAGYQWTRVAENVAAGQLNVAAVMTSWMKSTGHRANILGDYTMFGTAYAYNSGSTYKHYWTQNFGKSSTESCDFEDVEYVEPPCLNATTDSTDNPTAVLQNNPATDGEVAL